MITSIRAVSGSDNTLWPRVGQPDTHRPAALATDPAAARVCTGAPRPLPATQPNGDPCSLTLWGTEED